MTSSSTQFVKWNDPTNRSTASVQFSRKRDSTNLVIPAIIHALVTSRSRTQLVEWLRRKSVCVSIWWQWVLSEFCLASAIVIDVTDPDVSTVSRIVRHQRVRINLSSVIWKLYNKKITQWKFHILLAIFIYLRFYISSYFITVFVIALL